MFVEEAYLYKGMEKDKTKTMLITDFDGTLLTDDKQISDENIRAIKGFVDQGGLFTVATGRGFQMARKLMEQLDLQIPAVILNGAAIYDFQTNEYLWHTSVGDYAREDVRKIMKEFPDVGVEILHPDHIFIPNANEVTKLHMSWENLTPCYCSFEELPKENWMKVLLACEKERMDEVMEYVKLHCSKEPHWVRSADIFYEMLPSGANKGNGLLKLLERMHLHDVYVVAIGDYNNDIEMIEAADYGVAVANAMEEVKEVADLVVTDNNHSAIADLLKHMKLIKNESG